MTLISLDNEAGDIPGLDNWRFEDILVVKVESLHSMEEVDCFHLALLLRKRFVVAVLWRPIFQLEDLAGCEQTNNSLPVLLSELMCRIINFKCNSLFSNFLIESFFVLVFFFFTLLHLIWRDVNSISEELNCIFEADVAGVIC